MYSNKMITKPNLDTKKPIGNGISSPVYHSGTTSHIDVKAADMSGGHMLNTTASTANLSAKFKNPQKKQDTGLMYSDQK